MSNFSVEVPNLGPGSGTVTSVDISVPAFLAITGGPITTSGTLAISLSGTALPVANGGTGGTSASAARTALSAAASGANTDIISLTIPRQGSQRIIQTADQTTANSDDLLISTGLLSAAAASGVSGGLTFLTGSVSGITNDTATGEISFMTGNNTSSGTNPNTGNIALTTGTAGAGGSRGDIDFSSNSLVGVADAEVGFLAGTLIQLVSAQGVQLSQNGASRPAASVDTRGTIWFAANGAGVQDQLQICVKDAADAYVWKTVTIT